MSLRRRISRLEEREARHRQPVPGLPEDFDPEAEVACWEGAADALEGMPGLAGNAVALAAVGDLLRDRLEWLCQVLSWGPKWAESRRRLLPEERRWPLALVAFFRLLPEGQRPAVATAEALGSYGHGAGVPPPPARGPWLRWWLLALVRLESRLPPDLAPETLAALVGVYLRQAEQVYSFTAVCPRCGLRRPARKPPPLSAWPPPPEFFASCPHCGDAEWAWEHQSEQSGHPCRDLAAAELAPGGLWAIPPQRPAGKGRGRAI